MKIVVTILVIQTVLLVAVLLLEWRDLAARARNERDQLKKSAKDFEAKAVNEVKNVWDEGKNEVNVLRSKIP